VNTIHEIRVSLKCAEELRENDILALLGDSNFGVSLPVLYGRLQDYWEADFPFEFLMKALEHLVEQGAVILQEGQGVSSCRRRKLDSALNLNEEKWIGMFPGDSLRHPSMRRESW